MRLEVNLRKMIVFQRGDLTVAAERHVVVVSFVCRVVAAAKLDLEK